MKLSQMDTSTAAETLVRIAEPVANIMNDKKVEDVIKTLPDAREGSLMHMIAQLLPRVVPLALKDHKDDLYEIVGALGQMPKEEVEKANILVTMRIIRDSFDKDLLDFFGFTANLEETGKQE